MKNRKFIEEAEQKSATDENNQNINKINTETSEEKKAKEKKIANMRSRWGTYIMDI